MNSKSEETTRRRSRGRRGFILTTPTGNMKSPMSWGTGI